MFAATLESAAHHFLAPVPRGALPGPALAPMPAAAETERSAPWLLPALDEVDYGMLVVQERRVLHLNHAARRELDSRHALQLLGGELRAQRPEDVAPLHDALGAAQRGLRKLLTLGDGAQRVSVAVVPLWLGAGAAPAALLMLGKSRVCQPLSLQWFARSHGLTPAESRVLEELCEGREPREVADSFGVGLATVRTQIGSIRAKTGADSIRDLVRQVAVLPPMLSTLRLAV